MNAQSLRPSLPGDDYLSDQVFFRLGKAEEVRAVGKLVSQHLNLVGAGPDMAVELPNRSRILVRQTERDGLLGEGAGWSARRGSETFW